MGPSAVSHHRRTDCGHVLDELLRGRQPVRDHRIGAQERLGRWQIEGYARIVAEWCEAAAGNAGETCAVPFETLGRVLVGSVIGVVLHYLSDHDSDRSGRDLQAAMEMLVRLANVGPAANAP